MIPRYEVKKLTRWGWCSVLVTDDLNQARELAAQPGHTAIDFATGRHLWPRWDS